MEKIITEIKYKAIDGTIFDSEQECINYEKLTPIQRAAIYLHSTTCHANHDDGCGWFWEMKGNGIHDWSMISHYGYLEKVSIVEKEYKKFFRILYPDAEVIPIKE